MAIELPKDFQSWAEFYESIEKHGLINDRKIVYMPRIRLTPEHRNDRVPAVTLRIEDIKEELFKELWANRKRHEGLSVGELEFLFSCVTSSSDFSRHSGILEKLDAMYLSARKREYYPHDV